MNSGDILKDVQILKYSENPKFSQNDLFQFYKNHIFSVPDHVLIYRTIINESLGIRRKYVASTLIICLFLFAITGFGMGKTIPFSLSIVFFLWILLIPILSVKDSKKYVDIKKLEYFGDKYISENYTPNNRGEIYQIVYKEEFAAMFCLRKTFPEEISSSMYPSNTGIIESFIVSKKLQGQGVGTFFLSFAEKSLKAFNYDYIGLSVIIWNDNARRFYQKRGFFHFGTDDEGFLINSMEFWIKKL